MNKIHLLRNTFAVLVVAGFGVVSYISYTAKEMPKVEAGSGDNVAGYAWSDTVGWISFNSTNESGATASYGVNITPMTGVGAFSGTAWSRGTTDSGGVGWISFDRAVTGNPPAAPYNTGGGAIAQVNWNTGRVTGWARALSACDPNCATNSGAGANSGGWDGWIKLSDDSISAWNGNGVRIDATGKFSGHAWGGTQVDINGNSVPGGVSVVGWIDFAPAIAAGNGVHITTSDGVCGTSDEGTFSVAPTTNLCSSGTATTVVGAGPWTWNCNGSSGGANDSCMAYTNVVNGSCGSADGVAVLVAPSVNLCSSGTATAVSGSGPWTWSCNGANGGTDASCSAPKIACNNDSVCDFGETITNCPNDCKVKYQQF